MALSILDGNQSATTLSTILSSGQHITAHTVVSLGTQAITDIVNATSANLTNTQLRASAVTVGGTVTVGNSLTISSLPAISGTVTVNSSANFDVRVTQGGDPVDGDNPFPVSGTVAIGAGTNRIGVVTVGGGTVTIGAGTAQIGSVTASISGTVPISISSVTVGNSVTIGSLPAISGTVTANLAGSFNGAIETVGDVGNTSHAVAVHLYDDNGSFIGNLNNPFGVSGTVTIGSALPAGTNRIGVVTIGAGTVTIGAGTNQIGSVTASISGTVPISISSVTVGNSVTIGSLPAISGTVTANLAGSFNGAIETVGDVGNTSHAVAVHLYDDNGSFIGNLNNPFGVSGTVTIGSALPAGTNRIGVVTIGGGTVTIGAGTAQIGSVTASISGTVPVSGTFFQATQPVSLTTLPALVAGTAQIGSVTASISGTVPISITSVTIGSCVTHGVTIANTVVTFYPMQGTTVTNSNFTSTTASTTLVSAVANREVLTVFNEGAGNLHISPGATCTTVAYQVRLSSGDYWECPQGQLSLAHTAVFATAGTARVTQVS